jgi:hypothetical protein
VKLPPMPARWDDKSAGGKGWPMSVVPAADYDELRKIATELAIAMERATKGAVGSEPSKSAEKMNKE